jgi:hypothetical protein
MPEAPDDPQLHRCVAGWEIVQNGVQQLHTHNAECCEEILKYTHFVGFRYNISHHVLPCKHT